MPQFFISPPVFLRHYGFELWANAAKRANAPENLDRELNEFWDTQRAAAIAGEKGPATWGQPVELPPPTAGEVEMRLFADPLIRGALEHRDTIDEHIKKHAKNWEFHRIAAVDRNIMR